VAQTPAEGLGVNTARAPPTVGAHGGAPRLQSDDP